MQVIDDMMPLEFRQAEAEDLDEIWELYTAVVMRSSGSEEDPYWVMGVHPSRKELSYEVEDGTLYIATLYGEVVAATLIEQSFVAGYETFPWKSKVPLRDAAVLHLFAVSPDFRGQKISSRFLDYCIEATRELGYKVIRLDVMPHLKHAQAAYLRAGFENLGIATLGHADPRMARACMFELVL